MNKYTRIAKMRKDNDEYYKRLGWTPGKKSSPYSIPEYTVKSTGTTTSDAVPENGRKAGSNFYTGEELLGIATMHKSNSVPVRKDRKKNAVEISQMRRG